MEEPPAETVVYVQGQYQGRVLTYDTPGESSTGNLPSTTPVSMICWVDVSVGASAQKQRWIRILYPETPGRSAGTAFVLIGSVKNRRHTDHC